MRRASPARSSRSTSAGRRVRATRARSSSASSSSSTESASRPGSRLRTQPLPGPSSAPRCEIEGMAMQWTSRTSCVVRRFRAAFRFCAVVAAAGALVVLVVPSGEAGAAGEPAVVDSAAFVARELPPARGPARAPSKRVADLLARMTLREKVGQMTQLTLGTVVSGADQEVRLDPAKLERAVVEYGVGSILNVSDQALPLERWHELLRGIQAAAVRTRLKVPVLYGIDTIHGANYVKGATLFPQPLAMAASWNPELLLAGSRIAAAETRAAGIPWNFSPVLDVGRQPLWPRLYETYGEDPYLATVMGVATVRGYQGTDASA